MSPETHLLLSWIVAAKTTRHPRDCRLVALAGVLPDVDGLGLIVDLASGERTSFYQQYHHYLLHGAFGAVVIAGVLVCFARDRGRVALLALAMVHLHLLCDFIGSRGPTPGDIWPICYLEPFRRRPVWMWGGQWQLDGWQNKTVFFVLFLWAWQMSLALGHSVVGVFNRRADAVFVGIIRRWYQTWRRLAGLGVD